MEFIREIQNKSLLYGIQTEEGISPSEQTGSFGPKTKANLPFLSQGSDKVAFIKLLQYALYLNGSKFHPGRFDGVFDSGCN